MNNEDNKRLEDVCVCVCARVCERFQINVALVLLTLPKQDRSHALFFLFNYTSSHARAALIPTMVTAVLTDRLDGASDFPQ